MAIVNSNPMRRVGVGAQYICFWEKEQTDNQIAFAANVTKLKTVASIQTTEERSESKVFGSNEVYDVDTSVTPPKMTVENLAFPPIVLATMRGNEIKNGFVVHSTYDEPGYFAYGVVFPKKSGKTNFVWYPKCKLVSASDAANTKDDSGPNTQNRSVEIQSFTFDDKGSYKVEYDTELLSGDTDPQITEEKFFEKPLLAPLVSE